MRSVKLQTARVHWHMGQSLLPAHFYAQETSLHEDVLARFRGMSVPYWGVLNLRWDDFQLQKGMLSIQSMNILLSSGTLLDVPGNANPVGFNLNATGQSRVTVHLHLDYEGEVVTPDGQVSEDESVERVLHRIKLSSEPYSDRAAEVFRLGVFEKSVDGIWQLDVTQIPPLARSTQHPFFDSVMNRTQALCTVLHQLLLEEIQENFLSGQNLLAVRETLKSLYRFRATLTNAGRDIHPHPYELFRALHDLYIDLCVLRDTEPASVDVYRHETPYECFNPLLEQLESKAQLSRSDTPYIPFQQQDGMHLCVLPEEARAAKQIYWLAQKPTVASRLELTGTKLACESRLALVHQRSLRGVPFAPLDSVPFHHSFSSEVDFYRLSPGDEWDHVIREGRLAFYQRPELQDVRFSLYWRND